MWLILATAGPALLAASVWALDPSTLVPDVSVLRAVRSGGLFDDDDVTTCATATPVLWPGSLAAVTCQVNEKSGVGWGWVIPPWPYLLPQSLLAAANASTVTITVSNDDTTIVGADAHVYLLDQDASDVWSPDISAGDSGSFTFPAGAVPLPRLLQLTNVTLIVANFDLASQSENTVSLAFTCPDGSQAGEDFCTNGAAFTRTIIEAGGASGASHWATGGCGFTSDTSNATLMCTASGAPPNGTPKDCGSFAPYLVCNDCTGLC